MRIISRYNSPHRLQSCSVCVSRECRRNHPGTRGPTQPVKGEYGVRSEARGSGGGRPKGGGGAPAAQRNRNSPTTVYVALCLGQIPQTTRPPLKPLKMPLCSLSYSLLVAVETETTWGELVCCRDRSSPQDDHEIHLTYHCTYLGSPVS